MAGVYFLVLSAILLILFWIIFRLIDDGKRLSESLQHQKTGLKLMMCIVILSYVIAGIIYLFYGQYYKLEGVTTFVRAIIYPITVIIIELPNIMVMYIIHWQSYKP